MSTTKPNTEDPTIKSKATGTAEIPPQGTTQGAKCKNAFAELMAPKPKPPHVSRALASMFGARDALGAYTADPARFPPSRVIYHNESFVAINDLYPKASVHTLLLPRSPHSRQHPFDAFEDVEFLTAVREEVTQLKRLGAKELQRRHGPDSAQDKLREGVLNGDVEWEDGAPLPAGRDWEKEFLVGVHAHPSMNDLHVHVLSRDMVSESMRQRKHYQSFNTGFLVPIADFPLAADDPRRNPALTSSYLKSDLRCWRCGRVFGNRFKELKTHLAEEFEEWKKE
ncbi:HIT domain-containing protein [Xylaria intraflava]|nr:HIT domain-containing protein [Xylaria intraflava]